jgi:type IV secretion system protein VirB6
MDESAPITWLINQINTIVSSGAAATASTIATTISPLVSVCFGIYIMLITINYLRGAETEPVLDFGMRCAGFAVIIGLGLNASNYVSMVVPIVTGLGGDLSNAVSGGTVSAGTLDQLALHYLQIIDDGFEAASGLVDFASIGAKILVSLKAIIIMLGLVPFLVVATLFIIIANVGSLLVSMVGPLFFGFLLFPATRQYFSAWVNTALSYALIPMFVAVIATISVGLSAQMLSNGGTLNEASFKMVFLAAIGNLILLFLLKQVSALASSLTAGGINASMPGSIGTLANSIRSGAMGSVKEAKSFASAYRGGRDLAARARSSISNRFNSIRKAG